MTYSLPDNVTSEFVDTDRLRVHYLATKGDGEPVILLHGNIASSLFWDETLATLPDGFKGIAVDLRSFGDTEPQPVDATRGVGDFSDDLGATMDALGIEAAHLVGWSTGGLVAMRYTKDNPSRVRSMTLVDSVPPHGFGGTGDVEGTPVNEDYSGTGAAIVPQEVLDRIRDEDRSSESDMSPRVFMNAFYWKQGYTVDSDREDAFVEELFKCVIGEDNLPGDIAASAYWPGFAPGTRGVNNALSGKYSNIIDLIDVEPKPPLLWIQGTDDLVVSDASLYDMGNLGKLDLIPDYPGEEVYPIQPMMSQMQWFVDRYGANGGDTTVTVIEGAGHGPHIDHSEEFQGAFHPFLARARDQAGST